MISSERFNTDVKQVVIARTTTYYAMFWAFGQYEAIEQTTDLSLTEMQCNDRDAYAYKNA